MRTLLLLLALCMPAGSAHAQKASAGLACKPTGKDFVYDCTINLQHKGKPLEGAQVTLGADMPSMPMAHNVRPVKAQPGRQPGEYRATLDLEMAGEWAVKLRLAGPVKDQLILNYTFDEKGSSPTQARDRGKPQKR